MYENNKGIHSAMLYLEYKCRQTLKTAVWENSHINETNAYNLMLLYVTEEVHTWNIDPLSDEKIFREWENILDMLNNNANT